MNIKNPSGLALDHKENKIYWSDVAIPAILRANLDGSGSEIISSGEDLGNFHLGLMLFRKD